jgi:hypothetical protein
MISSPFAITTATNLVLLDAKNRGRATFTVSNRTRAAARGRAQLVPQRPEQARWLRIDGDAERDFAPDGLQQFSVAVLVNPGTPTGRHNFRLDMYGVTPAAGVTEGPSVAFEVTTVVPVPREGRKGYVATLVGAMLGALAGGAVGAVPGAIFALAQISRASVETVLTIVLIGVLVMSAPGVALGAWLNLRAQGFEGARETGLILAGAYFGWAVVLGLIYAVALKVSHSQVGAAIVLVALIAVLVPPVPARAIYLWLKSAGRIGGAAR